MENKYDLNDFLSVLIFKNHLENLSKEQLIEQTKNYENFLEFLDSFAVLSEIDSAFLLFKNEYIEKVESVIATSRFKYDDPDIVSIINSVIIYLNEIKAYSESLKNILKNQYLSYHEECRKVEIEGESVFLDALAFDAIAYTCLVNGNLDKIEGFDAYFLSSINYFMATVPEIFDNEEILEITIKKLNELAKKGWPFNTYNRKYSKETMENLQKVKTREE